MSPALRAIHGAKFVRFESVPHLSEYLCQIWLQSDVRVEKRGVQIGRHTNGQFMTEQHKSIYEQYLLSVNHLAKWDSPV